MKKFLIILAAAAVLFAGCQTFDTTSNKVGWSNYADIAVKDFTVVGVINLESQEVFTASPLELETSYRGSRIVWSDLMAEAANMGADDVINVRIEQTNQNRILPYFIRYLTGYTLNLKYKATALAIKYTDAVDRQKSGRQDNLKGQDS